MLQLVQDYWDLGYPINLEHPTGSIGYRNKEEINELIHLVPNG